MDHIRLSDSDSFKFAFIQKIANSLRRFMRLSSDVRLFIASQFALESDFGRSSLALRSNNYCGMKVPKLRITTAVNVDSIHEDFASYVSLADCVLDYVLWLQYSHVPAGAQSSVEDFASHLRVKGYCPDKDYISRIYSVFNQFK